MKLTEKDKVTLNLLAERINMLVAQGRSDEAVDLRIQHRELLAKAKEA